MHLPRHLVDAPHAQPDGAARDSAASTAPELFRLHALPMHTSREPVPAGTNPAPAPNGGDDDDAAAAGVDESSPHGDAAADRLASPDAAAAPSRDLLLFFLLLFFPFAPLSAPRCLPRAPPSESLPDEPDEELLLDEELLDDPLRSRSISAALSCSASACISATNGDRGRPTPDTSAAVAAAVASSRRKSSGPAAAVDRKDGGNVTTPVRLLFFDFFFFDALA